MQDELTSLLATEFNLPSDHVAIYAGSSDPLQFATLAFTSPTRSYVTADPSYEAGMVAAAANGAKVIKVPLTSTYAHDVKAMVAADPNAGVLYICSPNNPTGTLTPKEDILWALEHKPAGSILLVDEAYIHFADSPSVLDQVALGKDLIVLRTFSKIYGMAGLRCGVAFGRPDLLAKLRRLRHATPCPSPASPPPAPASSSPTSSPRAARSSPTPATPPSPGSTTRATSTSPPSPTAS